MFLVEMEINMIEKAKNLTLSQRIKIEDMLNKRCRKSEIAKELDKSPSTISREINRHHIIKPHNAFKKDNSYNCIIYYKRDYAYLLDFNLISVLILLSILIIMFLFINPRFCYTLTPRLISR